MFYPKNFLPELEKPLIDLLLQLEKEFKKKKYLDKKGLRQMISQLLLEPRFAQRLKNKFPNLWWLNYVTLKYPKKFSARFLSQLARLTTKTKIRSLSGVVSVTIFTKGVGCHHHCIYCPNQPSQPKSYLADEPAVLRAKENHFDPYLQVQKRLLVLALSGHPLDKVEVIIKGGTFSNYSYHYRKKFVQRIFDAANTNTLNLIKNGQTKENFSPDLLAAQNRNERAKSRIVGINIETRPDLITKNEITFLRKLGVTQVEIGVQALDDQILQLNGRGHNIASVKKATYLLKEAGFKIGYHLMPNLPGSNPQKDLILLKKVFETDFSPDYLKIYPTVVTRYSQLTDWYREGKYQPYPLKKLLELLTKFKRQSVPPWVRISRLGRDITKKMMVVEIPSNLRQLIKTDCSCLRCREIRDQKLILPIKLRIMHYLASERPEYFLEFIDQKERSLAFLRLRLLKNQSMVRELHVYGQATPLGQRGCIQHHHLGQKLLKKAEEITQKMGVKKLSVIAGIGVRPYYRRLGYRLTKTYMIKKITQP